jgi:hypothetical protein
MFVTRILCYTVYSVRYYPRFHITAIGLGTYYLLIQGHTCICACYGKANKLFQEKKVIRLSFVSVCLETPL